MRTIRYPLLLALLGAALLGLYLSTESRSGANFSSEEAPVDPSQTPQIGSPEASNKASAGSERETENSLSPGASVAASVADSSPASAEPEWFAQVADPSRLALDPLILEKPELEGIATVDLSEMEIRELWVEKIYSLYSDEMDKHQRRERSRLLELFEETSGEQTVARAEVLKLEVDGVTPTDDSFLLVGFNSGEPLYIQTVNQSAAESTAADLVRQNVSFDSVFGPDIDGSGFFFNVNDHGIARQHLEFQIPNGGGSRVIEREVEDDDSHMDHVSGTVGAHGFRIDAKGMAPAITMYSLNQQSDADVDLLGMQYAFQPRRSIGGTTSLGSSLESGDGGEYQTSARTFDESLLEAPYYLHFYAAANNGGWDTVSTGRAASKNLITVASGGNVSRDTSGNLLNGGSLSGFSSRGPSDDGRIKPDITGNGESVLSTTGTSGYGTKQGTSMATPNVSGSSILLQDYFSKRFPGHLMRSMTLKNLILHTADDLGNTGPDYRYGWGFMNTKKAGDLIKEYADNPGNRRITEAVMRDGNTHTYTFTWDGVSPLVANLTWLDYPGTSTSAHDDRSPDIVYDLDLRITSPTSSTVHLPWAMPFVLNGFNTSDWDTDAVKADNTTDNVEQVRIGSPTEAGVYTVTVSHKGTISASHEVLYSLIVSGVDNAASAPAPTITTFTPNEGVHDHLQVEVSGTGFLLGADVSLQAPGLDTVEGYGEMVSPTEIKVFFPLDRVPAGDYSLVVENPDGQSVSASTAFTVLPQTDLFYEDFDGVGFSFATSAWSTGADTGTNDWTLSNTASITGNSAHVPTRTEEVSSYLDSPAIIVPATSDPIILSFQHQWDFEIELPTVSFGAPQGEDGAVLMVSVDGGDFQYVDQSFSGLASAAGTEIVSTDYWDNLDWMNPIEYPSGTTYAWTDESGGWQRTTVTLDPAIYGDKTLQFRWWLGTQNTGSDDIEGWWIDNVSLSIRSTNMAPQVNQAPSDQATATQSYSETIGFTDSDIGDTITLSATTLPAWLGFTDDGSGSGTLSGTPTGGDTGNHTVTIEASDGTDTRTYTFTIIVSPSGGNNAPSFDTSALDVAIIESAYTFDITASDLDGHILSITTGSLPAWLSFTDNGDGTATLSGTPSSYALGTVDLSFTVSDGIDSTAGIFALQILPPAEIEFTANSASVDEDAGTIVLLVSRSLNSVGPVTVDFATSPGTATAGDDFTANSGTLSWSDGDTTSKTIEIAIVDDLVYNEVEDFSVTLSNVTGSAELGSDTIATISIDDDDINLSPSITLISPSTSSVSLPTGVSLVVETTVSDDGILNPLTLLWSQISGPDTAVISSITTENTEISFPQSGDYEIRLTADDGLGQTNLDLSISVGGPAPITVAQTELTVHLQFDDASGTTASDTMTTDGESNDGTLNGGPTWSIDAADGGSLSFDGSDDYVSIENSTAINDGTFAQKTIAFWFKTSDVNTRQILYEQGGNTRGLSIYLDGGNVYAGAWNNGENGWNSTYLSTTVTTSTWHHVALVLNASEGGSILETDIFHLYLDGSLADSGDAAPLNVHTGGIGIGGINNSANFHDSDESSGFHFAGLIDDFVHYKRALTPSEISALTGGGNIAPSVNTGGPYNAAAGGPLVLSPTITDDGLPETPGTVATTWSLISGPGLANFADASNANSTVTFDTQGTYVLRLTASDGAAVTFSDTEVSVAPPGPAVFITQSASSTSVIEGSDSDTYTLTLGIAPTHDIDITITGTAQATVNPTNVTFTTSDWQTPQVITVTAVDDLSIEGSHSATITHSATSSDPDYNGISINDLLVDIIDNDSAGELSLNVSSTSVDEDVGTVSFTVSRVGGSIGPASVNYATSNVSATSGDDYTAASGSFNWSDGDATSRTINITILDDSDVEASEVFELTLSNASGASLGTPATTAVTIDDNEQKTYLLNFGLTNYTTDGANTWQSFNLTNSTVFGGNYDPVAVSETTLADTSGSTTAGITFATDTSATGAGNTALAAGLSAGEITADPYDWFDPTEDPQREYVAVFSSSQQSFTFSGFAITDVVDFEFVFARPGTGDRAVTINYRASGDIMNDQQVDEDGGPQYPSITSLTGSTSYTFEFDMSGSTWGCLPNAMRIRVSDGGDFSPAIIPDLVGWYDAQALSGSDGTAITTWADTTDGNVNTTANDLIQITSGTFAGTTAIAPTLQTVTLNSYDFRAIRFLGGNAGDFELLKAESLVTTGDSERTIVTVYKGGGGDGGSRPLGFGSSLEEDINGDRIAWNLGTETNGSSRFDGAYIDGYSTGHSQTEFVLRVATMESFTSFDEYIDILDPNFADNQVLSNGTPNNSLGPVRGDFHIGDLQASSFGGASNAIQYDILEILVYDSALSDSQRLAVQEYLKTKYTTNPNAGTTPTAASSLGATTASSTQIDLAWIDNSGDETGFMVKRSVVSGSGFSTIATTAADATSYSDTTLTPGTTYYYQIIATNGTGDSAPSNEDSATTWTLRQQFFSDSGLDPHIEIGIDTDEDGISNEDEYNLGTDPNDRSSTFHVGMSMPSPGTFRANLPTVSGRYYRVVYRDSLDSGNWVTLPGYGNIVGTGNDVEINDTTTDARFYRIEARPTPWE